MRWSKSFILCILSVLFIQNCDALFEDQVGKFDWRVQHLGCPKEVFLVRSKLGYDQVLVSTTRDVIGSIDVNSGEILWRRVGDKLSSLSVNNKTSEVVLTTKDGNTQTFGSVSKTVFGTYDDAMKKLKIFDQTSKKEIAQLEIPSDGAASVKQFSVLEGDNNQLFEIVVVRQDCRIDFYEARRSDKMATLEWSRFEGLAEISSVEMIDLPLSESQATIETEFSVPDATIFKSFLLRVTGQFEQFRHSFVALGNQFARAFQLFTSGTESFSNVLRVLWGENASPSKRPRSGASLSESNFDLPMERDYFNLHKLIIVSTKSGSLYGIHNQYGTVVWSLYLGNQFEPMKTQMNKEKVPLFIQRTTANFQFDSQAAVAFNLKGTQKTRVVFFNPVNGKIVDSHTYNSVKRVEMAPFTNKDLLSPLIIVDSNDKVQFLPTLESDFQSTQSIHLFSIDTKQGILKGDLVELHQKSLSNTWSTKLHLAPDEKIISVTGRNRNERVHSQGRVLGDRSVLYKYANPNLIVVASVDETHTILSINLIDAVSGAIIYTARHERAMEPVNVVHCENWVVYSYWNEKARRTELGVIELYEGLEQTNAKNFNSFTTVQNPLNVIANAYVFPQGVSAMAVSETEQGLTTRSVVIAMPFGGVLEISRKILDARRPFELTPELREEMIYPYMPEIPIATEDLINYNQTVLQIDGIKTAPSGLESTSLVLAYGLDLFYTRLTPSGTFDVLKDDFDYVLISIVLLGLVIASVALKRISRYQNLKQAWA